MNEQVLLLLFSLGQDMCQGALYNQSLRPPTDVLLGLLDHAELGKDYLMCLE